MTAPNVGDGQIAGTDSPRAAFRLLMLTLLLAWGVALFARSYWTPDEPREAALSASMMSQPMALPQLAGATFAEKPPLTYWLSGSAMRLFGSQPAAARLPLLLYALLGVLAIARLGRAAGGRVTGYCAGAIFASALLVYQVQIWLECDALLLCGVCVALCGGYLGVAARSPRQRVLCYLLLHVGLTVAFFAKNLAGWLVPVTALVTFIVWERRWREFVRWELWVGALLPLAMIAAWTLCLAHRADGAALLRILYWDNLVGRAVAVDAPTQYAYALAHRNTPGKYLIELIIDLLPWTVLLLCALARIGRTAIRRAALPSSWRFALCACVPSMLMLSFAATARSIYAAPCMPGLALLCALWISKQETARAAIRALWVSRALIALLALGLGTLSIALLVIGAPIAMGLCVLSAAVALGIFVALVLRWDVRGREPSTALTLQAAAFALLLAVGALAPLQIFDRSQDLAQLARSVSAASADAPLMLWHPDETTLAWSQLYLPAVQWRALRSDEADTETELDNALSVNSAIRVLVQVRTPAWGAREWLSYLRGSLPAHAIDAALIPASLRAQGLHAVADIERPGGRRYLLLTRSAS